MDQTSAADSPILTAFRVRFAHSPDINTYTPFGFYEAGYLESQAEIERLRAICAEWLPIIERQFASLPPAPDSLGWQTALHRVERLRKAVGNHKAS